MKKIFYWICVLIYISGTLVYALPDLYKLKMDYENREAIRSFEERTAIADRDRSDADEKKRSGDDGEDAEAESEVSVELYEEMQQYNCVIAENGQAELRDPWSFEQEVLDLDAYGVRDGVIGVISIPKMEVELPIYLGAKEDHMAKGAVLLGQTSFPASGENINSVIAAHRGWKGSPMFRDIEAMAIGDIVTIRNPWERLTYQVTDIKVIMPDDVHEILIQPGKNMVTLVTCHPYTGNSRRYVVYCEKTAVGDANDEKEQAGQSNKGVENPNAERVRLEAKGEDQEMIDQDVRLRKIGYIVIAALGALVVLNGVKGRKNKKK